MKLRSQTKEQTAQQDVQATQLTRTTGETRHRAGKRTKINPKASNPLNKKNTKKAATSTKPTTTQANSMSTARSSPAPAAGLAAGQGAAHHERYHVPTISVPNDTQSDSVTHPRTPAEAEVIQAAQSDLAAQEALQTAATAGATVQPANVTVPVQRNVITTGGIHYRGWKQDAAFVRECHAMSHRLNRLAERVTHSPTTLNAMVHQRWMAVEKDVAEVLALFAEEDHAGTILINNMLLHHALAPERLAEARHAVFAGQSLSRWNERLARVQGQNEVEKAVEIHYLKQLVQSSDVAVCQLAIMDLDVHVRALLHRVIVASCYAMWRLLEDDDGEELPAGLRWLGQDVRQKVEAFIRTLELDII